LNVRRIVHTKIEIELSMKKEQAQQTADINVVLSPSKQILMKMESQKKKFSLDLEML